ncbi:MULTISPECIES: ABC transporter ATP-binding protein [Rhizobium/Agrobacterium group]|uniref:ATP-binding cassette domain-containing protein n=2 Tax=Rhizobium/Agrobacterium group TaxID=227290 RepID=A0A9X3KQN0_9HYPH|nr:MULTISPECIES: ATP-binding cassette domain-containing protein [Rhizobium/Agrobacterium group]MBO9126282.1 ATP-binding cassette domain-containing protein [Rhizobium sp. 16-488-2b]MBO9176866.1 ATP-binding cassette domain-containing protein [Rhizobium sp. 16-488-2a]MBO9197435.1 ATP-binding cassette domain-containing protein [Rhizobium sp. 16-449-1b]MCZ7466700.1 ATP-binding cassette domain-containing protein [Rhizobium rhizogenes]MCZ7939266.1 ATP-binding cassette domain-containing protein [Agrob
MQTLEIEGLIVRRGVKRVVDGVSMSLKPGTVTALLGPNGAGKSSLVLALAGALPLEAGSVHMAGRRLSGLGTEAVRAAGVAAVPEGHRVLPGLSVDDNLRTAGHAHSRPELDRALDEIYSIFGELAERKNQRAGSMSGGQQQMLALGQALICRPKFVLADEMSLGLAPLIVKRLMNVIERLAQEGTGILLIEQFTAVALSLADHAIVMSRGRFAYSGEPQRLISEPDILHKAYLA